MRYLLIVLCACLGQLLHIPNTYADKMQPGYLAFTQQTAEQWTLVWKAPKSGGITPATQPTLPADCFTSGEPLRDIRQQTVTTSYAIRCQSSVAGKAIGLSHFDNADTDVLLRVALLERPVQVMRLTSNQPQATIQAQPNSWQVASSYFITGVEHILEGYDHLLFVVALVLLLNGFWPIAQAVTAFTIAHSITLIGTTLGYMGLPQAPVEAVIALSIIFLAVEIVKQRPEQRRLSERAPWLVAFVFGLLHGFGFAGALSEIGLPETDITLALLTFNLGVEAGQLIIVAACLFLQLLLQKVAMRLITPANTAASYAIGITASYWLIERLL